MNTDSARPIRSENRFSKPCFDWRSACLGAKSKGGKLRLRLMSPNDAWVPHPHADLQACAAVFPSLQTVFCMALSPEAWPSSHEVRQEHSAVLNRLVNCY
jgi:hypothetical protein